MPRPPSATKAARNSRVQRMKKKEYIKNIEEEIKKLQSENEQLKSKLLDREWEFKNLADKGGIIVELKNIISEQKILISEQKKIIANHHNGHANHANHYIINGGRFPTNDNSMTNNNQINTDTIYDDINFNNFIDLQEVERDGSNNMNHQES
ncbi:7945_t:CDS:2 [Ambispora leptoticha]|uniref:7945_t:CDS:1 n=1 Tax=Ambispora leptoticha TaxID=144679 RepID=A0A9N9D798_9GLOM|nr:7945_t:CDS:2 [Ambispora leptoticha]